MKRPTAHEVLSEILAENPDLKASVGEREGGDPADEIQHFYLCKACQQPVDMRDLAVVFHHEEPGHQPLPAENAERLLRISELLRTAISRPKA